MMTIGARLPASLVSKIDEAVAAGHFSSRSSFLRTAVQLYLLHQGAFPRRRDPDRRGFARRLEQLSKDPRYSGRFAALHENRPLDVDDNQEALVRRILKRKEEPIHVVAIEAGKD